MNDLTHLDASGQARVIGRKLTNVTQHPDLKNVAVWTYYQNAHRLDGARFPRDLLQRAAHRRACRVAAGAHRFAIAMD